MKVFTCTSFTGHWPVGTAAVIVADDKTQAKQLLEIALAQQGIAQQIDEAELDEISASTATAYILNNGDY